MENEIFTQAQNLLLLKSDWVFSVFGGCDFVRIMAPCALDLKMSWNIELWYLWFFRKVGLYLWGEEAYRVR